MHILISAVSSAKSPTGICRHAANLAISLAGAAEVSRVSLLVGRWQEAYFTTSFALTNRKLQVMPVSVQRNAIARNTWYLFGLPNSAAACQADIVHLSFPAPFFRKRFRCPVVTTVHDLYPYDIPGNFGLHRVVLNRLFFAHCVRESDILVCVSDWTLQRLRAVAGSKVIPKTIRIYPYVNLDGATISKHMLPILDGHRFILTVAQHRQNKNLPLLLSAFAELRQRPGYSAVRLLVAGANGPETPRLRRLARRLSLDPHVVFTDVLTDPELHWAYRNCALFITLSSIEGFGYPLIEAIRAGSPTLSSDIPAHRETAGLACRYIDVTSGPSAATVASAMAQAMTQSESKSGVWKRFSAEEAAVGHLALYRSLISSSKNNLPHTVGHALPPRECIQESTAAN